VSIVPATRWVITHLSTFVKKVQTRKRRQRHVKPNLVNQGECNEQSNRNKKQGSYDLQWIIYCIHCNLFDHFNFVLVCIGTELLSSLNCHVAARRFHSPLSACFSSSRILFSRSLRRSRNCHQANATTPPKTRNTSMTMMGANSLMVWIGMFHSGNHTAQLASP